MCLTTTFRKGFIAPKDIIVYKKLLQRNSTWFTPCRACIVSLDSEFIPDRDTPNFIEYSHFYELLGGVIHAYTKAENSEDYFKAIIPKGTRFWLQDDLTEIASEKLYLTSERAMKRDRTDLSSLYQEYCLDLLSKEGKRVSWSPEVVDPKGIFVYDSQAIGLESYRRELFPKKPLGEFIRTREDAEKDFSGRERTRSIPNNFPENSYIPSCGELSRALENILFINLTRWALSLWALPSYANFLSSTPYDENLRFWAVHPYSSWSDVYELGQVSCILPFRK